LSACGDRQRKKLASYFYRKGCSREEVEDCLQETALRAWRSFHTLREESVAWFFAIAAREFSEFVRKKNREREILKHLVEDKDPKPNPERGITSRDRISLVMECLDDPKDRLCLYMHDIDSFKFEEIAELVGISVSNAHYHVERARRILREKLGDWEPE